MIFKSDIENALKTLRDGGVILYPTDTVWGLGCDATNDDGIQKIYNIKNRNESKALILLVEGIDMLLEYVSYNDKNELQHWLNQFSDRPTTIIYKGFKKLATQFHVQDTIAIRIASDEFCKALIHEFGKPIVSTSANISNEQTPRFFNEINPLVKSKVDYIVQYKQDDTTVHAPSRIVSVENQQIKIIRA